MILMKTEQEWKADLVKIHGRQLTEQELQDARDRRNTWQRRVAAGQPVELKPPTAAA